jgi:hypothetical protein
MREILIGSKILPYESLYVIGKIWNRFGIPYAVPKFIVVIRDKRTGELKQNLTEEELFKVKKDIEERFYWQVVIVKLEDLDKEINKKYKEELLQAKAEGRIVFSFADALYNKIAELMKNKDPVELEV